MSDQPDFQDQIEKIQKCVDDTFDNCKGSFKCEQGITVGLNQQSLIQAQRICNNFKGIDTCLQQQTCINMGGSTTYDACIRTVQCLDKINTTN